MNYSTTSLIQLILIFEYYKAVINVAQNRYHFSEIPLFDEILQTFYCSQQFYLITLAVNLGEHGAPVYLAL